VNPPSFLKSDSNKITEKEKTTTCRRAKIKKLLKRLSRSNSESGEKEQANAPNPDPVGPELESQATFSLGNFAWNRDAHL
jgi:hypothetical protein